MLLCNHKVGQNMNNKFMEELSNLEFKKRFLFRMLDITKNNDIKDKYFKQLSEVEDKIVEIKKKIKEYKVMANGNNDTNCSKN